MTQFRGIDPINDDSWLMTKVKQNPEAFLVLAAGCALLLRGSGLGAVLQRSGVRNERWNDLRDGAAATARGYAADLRDRISDTAAAASDNASGYATALSENAGAISERASNYVSSLSDQVTDLGRNVADEATRMGARVVREQPFAIAALGVAVGAAVAALLPPSEVERNALRPVRDAASDAVNVAAERVKGAVSATAEHLKDAAEQKGLTPEGLKDVARNVKQTFGDTLARGTEPHAASSPQPAPSRPGSLS